MNSKLAEAAVGYIGIASSLQDRLTQDLASRQSREKAANDKIASVLDSLIESGCVPVQQKQAAAEMLSDHSSTLDILVNAAKRLGQNKVAAEKTASELGQAVDDGGSALGDAYDSLQSNYLGQRTTQKKASDIALAKILEDPRA